MKYGMFLVVLAVAGYAFADDDDCCSAEDRHEIQFIWHRVWSSAFTARRVSIAGAVFQDLFKHYPSSKALFERVKVGDPDSAEYHAHLLRVTNGLDTVINFLETPQVLREHLNHLAHQHVERKGVTKEYFEGFGDAFARVLPQVVSCFNVEAWNRCYGTLARRIAKDLP